MIPRCYPNKPTCPPPVAPAGSTAPTQPITFLHGNFPCKKSPTLCRFHCSTPSTDAVHSSDPTCTAGPSVGLQHKQMALRALTFCSALPCSTAVSLDRRAGLLTSPSPPSTSKLVFCLAQAASDRCQHHLEMSPPPAHSADPSQQHTERLLDVAAKSSRTPIHSNKNQKQRESTALPQIQRQLCVHPSRQNPELPPLGTQGCVLGAVALHALGGGRAQGAQLQHFHCSICMPATKGNKATASSPGSLSLRLPAGWASSGHGLSYCRQSSRGLLSQP